MAAQKIALITEGDGEKDAAPRLLALALQHCGCFHLFPRQPALNAHGCGNLTKRGGLEKFLEVAYRYDVDAVLVLIDSDGECPVRLARDFSARTQAVGARKPTAIVVAHTMYEVWFVASASALGGVSLGSRTFQSDIEIPVDPEDINNPKSWIEDKIRPKQYKETEDQVVLTSQIDFDLARTHSRSFRRFVHAVEELVEAVDGSTVRVTPN